MSCRAVLELLFTVLIGSVSADNCGRVHPELETVAEGTTVQFQLYLNSNITEGVYVTWYYQMPNITSSVLCSGSQCNLSNKYTQSRNGDTLTIKNVTLSDSGYYRCSCLNRFFKGWCSHGNLTVTGAKTSARKDQVHQKKISTKSINEHRSTTHSARATAEIKPVNTKVTADKSAKSNKQETHLKNISAESRNEFHSTTHGATATEESDTSKTEVNDSGTDYKVTSAVGDTGQVTTIAVTGAVAVGVMLTIIVVVIICKNQKKDDIHRAGQKSQTNSEEADGQDNNLPNDSIAGQPHSRQQSETVTSDVQHETAHNSGASYDQQVSSSAAEQINSEYATVVPQKHIIPSSRRKDTKKKVVREEEGTPEYATVVKSRQPGCSVEQSTQGGKDKNEHGLVYADLDLVSRPQREAVSKEYEATEYVSVDFRKTATLKSQHKQ